MTLLRPVPYRDPRTLQVGSNKHLADSLNASEPVMVEAEGD
jgi:hypothetical protein